MVEPGLADPRLSDHTYDLPMPCPGLLDRSPQRLHLGIAADEARHSPQRRGLQPRAGRTRPGQLVHVDGCLQPLYAHRPQRAHLHVTLHQLQGAGAQGGGAGCGELLQAGREVSGLAHGTVVHAQVAAYRTNHHFPGVDPDPDLDQHAFVPPHLCRVMPH